MTEAPEKKTQIAVVIKGENPLAENFEVLHVEKPRFSLKRIFQKALRSLGGT